MLQKQMAEGDPQAQAEQMLKMSTAKIRKARYAPILWLRATLTGGLGKEGTCLTADTCCATQHGTFRCALQDPEKARQ